MAAIAELVAQAKACHGAGDLRGAERLYRRALEADRANAEVLYLLGDACQALGKLSEAAAILEQAVRAKPDFAEAHNTLGAVWGRQAKLTEATACCRRALELKPNFAEAYYNLAAVAVCQNRLDEAAACWRRALELKPDYLAACYNLAAVALSQNEFEEAAGCWRRILELKPADAAAHGNLAAVLVKQEKLDEATACYRRALELKPDFAEAHLNLGALLEQQQSLDEASACFLRALELKPDFAEAHNNLGAVLEKQGQLDAATACYRRAGTLKPGFAEAHNNLGVVLAKQGDADAAEACWRRALELKPDFAEAYQNLGTVLAKQKKLDEAAACCRRALELKPDFAEAHNTMATVLRDQNKLDEAAACCRRALELRPNYAEAHGNLGGVLARQDEFDQAAACYRRALALKPDFAEVYVNLGAVLKVQGQVDEALACCRQALELKPDFAEASSNVGVLLTQLGRFAEAKECYLKAQQLHPKQDVWKLNLLSLCPIVFGSNEDIEQYRRGLLSDIEHVGSLELPFDPAVLAAAGCKPSFNLQFQGRNDRPIREAYARLYRDCFPGETPTGSSGRPRIGFVVSDQFEMLFLKSMGGVLERIDSDLFELVVIGSERGIALIRSEIRNPAIKLLPVLNTFDQFVSAIRAARFDLLYYWEVATDGINYCLPFLRLAPVQCTSWGIQVTSGIPRLDHYLSSALVEPEDAQSHYTENLILANTLLTYQQRVALPALPKSRAYFGIAREQHIYLCAQQLGKFQPDFDPILAGILRQDAKGVVVATEDRHGGFLPNQLRQRFAATMPDVADRVVFVPLQPTPDYLSLIAAADVLLDPLHFGGVNSSYDGFSLNKPIVTLPSQFQRGRYTLGCYKKMGLTDCLASDPRQYIEIAVALGTDAAYRSEVVEKIRCASPVLFEDVQAVREHERIFSELVEEARSIRHTDRE